MGEFFTPPPKSIKEFAQLVLETLDGIAESKSWAAQKLSDEAFKVALSLMGVDIAGDVTIDNIGIALGRKILKETGLDLGNVLDGENVRVKVERAGLKRVIKELGIDAPATREGLADALKVVIRRDIAAKVGDGEALSLVRDMGSTDDVEAIKSAMKKREKPLIDTKAARQNRERQARFRKSHKRVYS